MRRPSAMMIGSRVLTPLSVAIGLTCFAPAAEARPNLERKGGQWALLAGAAGCVPGVKADCTHADGRSGLSFGGGAELGYRVKRYLFIGAGYSLGFLQADFSIADVRPYRYAHQHGVFGILRPILPVWRFDLGFEVAPGFSRLTFRREGDERQYSQGFAFRTGPVIDVFITRRVFLGLKADLILNAHGKTCDEAGGTTVCHKEAMNAVTPVHQVIFGLHVGGTFL